VVVTCDTDDPAIGALLDEWWPRAVGGMPKSEWPRPKMLHTYRPHQGRAQLNQVRNNGLRALRDHAGIRPEDVVVVLDGDTMLASDALERHAALAHEGAELIIPYRFMIDEQVTPSVEAEDVLNNGVPRARIVTPEMERDLLARDRRYRRNLLLARLGLTKPHKPKLIGGHHAVQFGTLVRVNGFDEEYVGYRFNDDDLSRRLRLARPRVRTAIAVKRIEAYHLWHKVRAPDKLQEAPGFARWSRKDLPVRCVMGIENGLGQPEPVVRVVGG
jgi:glycosyltransferase involved in cell wall biosynthesis